MKIFLELKKNFCLLIIASFTAFTHCLFIDEVLQDGEHLADSRNINIISNDVRLFLSINSGQLFTELYNKHALLKVPQFNVFEPATYLASLIARNPAVAPAVTLRADLILREYLKRERTIELYIDPTKPRPILFPATGATQIFVGLAYAIIMSQPNVRFLFVQKKPYFNRHRAAITSFPYPNARYEGFDDPSEIKLEPGEVLVEFVTSPNNPDGTFRRPETNANIILADFVFSSNAYGPDGDGFVNQNLEWLRLARAQGKKIFSFDSASKHFGKAGDRWGYIWFDISDPYVNSIFDMYVNFIFAAGDVNTQAGALFLDAVTALIKERDNGQTLFRDLNKTIIKRHELLSEEIKARYPGSITTSIPGSSTFFGSISDPRVPPLPGAVVILQDTNTVVNNGIIYDGPNESFVRINLTGPSMDFAEFLNRLAGFRKYTEKDVLISSLDCCPQTTITANLCQSTQYIIQPGDCKILADTTNGNITILLPAFIDYEKSNIITIQKIAEPNVVTIISKDFTIQLTKECSFSKVQWLQPFFENGRWIIRN